MNDRLYEMYYSWLCELIRVKQDNKSYWLLANALHEKEFKYFVPNDDNRAYEGKNLREKFCDENNIEYAYDEFPVEVSMLEVIIALAYRCESIMADEMAGREMYEWFWKILENAGLDLYDDGAFYGHHGNTEVNEILNKIINREYRRDGKGGLFPLKRTNKDQRKVELWYQMNEYLVENYYSEEAIL
jgi:hypothetical protein